ncbi:MAG: hypothetical protein EOS07_05390 [Mesorhizobium sp.]|nr:MAG: hypothetical protein EOQ56_06270 [Mesorhizobium sp.]RWO12043.1 MAG: hypothetical protein EOS07_05390 [Mesorhizobium sp.]RWP07421.1 MAG: hypothetical protein EOQ99_08155 [Mesorhizobium sp.]RWP19423.1 MAG: hypothetical protein EOR00_07310 [Mesorhizobium sp.]RWP23694.1 MAG: hypothetical protein EOR01_07295 [Mesorhizobium sp.]
MASRSEVGRGVFQGTPTSHSFQHPSSVSALRADPPSPTRGEGRSAAANYSPGPLQAMIWSLV